MNSKNLDLYNRSNKIIPGGVHSPVRSFKGLTLNPLFMKKGDGAKIYDVEGRDYIDFCMSFGPLILGHKNKIVEMALVEALGRGWSFGTCEPYSLELAEFIIKKIPFIDQIRFVNSGTEAVMTALRMARGYTNREKIVKFSGCYHGHTDSMLIKAGSGLAGTSLASSKGIPLSITQDTIVFELGDFSGLKSYMKNHGKEVSSIIIEPLPANNGLLIQEKAFLQGLRGLCDEYGSLLIFDEVISGFRAHGFGGMSEYLGIIPDIVTYGKIIGGGLPVGAIAGPKKIMEVLAPIGEVYQAGTLSANPLAMIGGLETLKNLTPEVFETLRENTVKIVALFNRFFKTHPELKDKSLLMFNYESLFWINNIHPYFDFIFSELIKRGVYLAPNSYEVGFVSLAHNELIIAELEQRLLV
jgi:glutamate-1-semialdehyde 2,1-aminomutase